MCRLLLPCLAGLPIVLVAGCGGSVGTITGNSNQETNPLPSGNWTVAATSNVTDATYVLGGSMSNSNGSITATLHLVPGESGCLPSGQEISFTGTVTASGVISLTSAPFDNQTISVAANTPGGGLLTGTYKIAGGCAAGDNGGVLGWVEPSYTGTYAGTFQPASGNPVGVSMNIVQSVGNSDGEYNLTGSAQFTGSPCFTTGTITSSTVFGEYVQVTLSTDNGGSVQFTGIAVAVPQVVTFSGAYQITAGSCAGNSGSGSVSS